ncbi:MAG: hypothetical protein M1840_002896 [Geoglossum simile]|nr:MAG: hypothetical protein M1840_002896 [Geoglossum simile]
MAGNENDNDSTMDDVDYDSDSAINDVGDSDSGLTSSGRKRRKPSIPDQLLLSFVRRSTAKELRIAAPTPVKRQSPPH